MFEIAGRTIDGFEEAGYDTRGFDAWRGLDKDATARSQPQSRRIFPDPEELQEELQRGDVRVRIPDPREWQTYMDWLTERKLQALGVTTEESTQATIEKQDVEMQLLQQDQQQMISARPLSTLAQVPEGSEEELQRPVWCSSPVGERPEIVVPTPRGNCHNISANLEREIHEAHYHLEKAMHRQFDDDNSEYLVSTNNVRILPSRASISSTSKLNVAAPEFKFTPSAPSSPYKFVFSSPERQTGVTKPARQLYPQHVGHRIPQTLNGFGSASNVSVSAPLPGGTNLPSFPAGGFDFSIAGPAFQPSAPALQSADFDYRTATHGARLSRDSRRVFGPVDSDTFVKPVRRSKAVRIVRPYQLNDESNGEENRSEDDHGCVTQGAERQKRMRLHTTDGDDVPQFAVPTSFMYDKSNLLNDNGADIHQTISSNAENGTEHDLVSKMRPDTSVHTVDLSPSLATDQMFGGVKKHAKISAGGLAGEAALSDSLDSDVASAILVAGKPLDTDLVNLNSGPLELAGSATQPSALKHSARSSLSATAKLFDSMHKADKRFDTATQRSRSSGPRDDTRAVSSLRASPSAQRPSSHSPSPCRPSDEGDYQTAPVSPLKGVSRPASDEVDPDSYIEPSFNEIDEVMRQLDKPNCQLGVKRDLLLWRESSHSLHSLHEELRPNVNLQSGGPSPDPRISQALSTGEFPNDDSLSGTQDPFSDSRAGAAYSPSLHRTPNVEDVTTDNWNDVLSSTEDGKLPTRNRFFESHVEGLVDSVLQQRLNPLEKSLQLIQDCVTTLTVRNASRGDRRSGSTWEEQSDADDEDDGPVWDHHHRCRSQGKNRKLEKIKTVVLEALSTQQTLVSAVTPLLDMSEFHSAFIDMKTSIAQSASSNVNLDNIRRIVEDALNQQHLATDSTAPEPQSEDYERRILNMEHRLQEAHTRVLQEDGHRRAEEARELETTTLLRLAEEELKLLRDTAEDKDTKLHALDEERRELRTRLSDAEAAAKDLRQEVSDLNDETSAMESTIEEYRISSTKWRQEIDEAEKEKDVLRKTVHAMKSQLEDGLRIRENMRLKLDRLQQDIAAAAGQFGSEKAVWRNRDEEHRKKFEILIVRFEEEVRIRERLEREREQLEAQAIENLRSTIVAEQVTALNSRLEATVHDLRLESIEHEAAAARLERELHEVKDASQVEIQRTRMLMQTEIQVANNQANMIRADLERGNTILRTELEKVRTEADAANAKHELLLQEVANSGKDTLRKVSRDNSAALQELRQKYEQHLKGSRAQHARLTENLLEDKERSETHLDQKLRLSDTKVAHLQDKVTHLEEKLKIAKSAAHAAVVAAQTAKALPAPTTAVPDLPEKISPQALRESILVLQEQLQYRESRIERLQSELALVDFDAPEKLKERDTEIAWLRELLGVRFDDLSDLIDTLSRPAYDRNTVRDTAIRIRANLQMEQQEKERLAGGGGQSLPTQALATLTNFASPKAVQLAAAFGNWRKGKEPSLAALSQFTTTSRAQTPFRPAAATAPARPQSFLSGLITPPTSNVRRSAVPHHSRAHSRPDSSSSTSSSQQLTNASVSQQRQRANEPSISGSVPATPPLLRQQSYDQDAEASAFGTAGFYDDDNGAGDGCPVERSEETLPVDP
ncbi:hypothetical protein B0A49_02910 [Cryomyces minteri]|uniref:Uncharacterized protein n=1 Tax=Cryomyces minteri TaxID=331657 RepID=A0A4U0XJX6_9PEZI|nr:hypothetical protein B0A49_02910 [Cryomyces minteri]